MDNTILPIHQDVNDQIANDSAPDDHEQQQQRMEDGFNIVSAETQEWTGQKNNNMPLNILPKNCHRFDLLRKI